ncbi:MAG: ATP-binding protein [Chloroflexota bacterium]
MEQLRRLDLLIVDGKLARLPADGWSAGKPVLFQLVAARRYTRGSLLVTSNIGFDGWGKLFGDDVIASATWIDCCIAARSSRSTDGLSLGSDRRPIALTGGADRSCP